MSLFDAKLLQLATGSLPAHAERYAGHLSDACSHYGITTPERLAAFLGQIGHESAGLAYVTEVWGPNAAQMRYEGRADLGNVQSGDGERFKGHGLIQVTGRFNHAAVRDALRRDLPGEDVPDFEAGPDQLALPRWACWSAAQWWASHGCNALADAGDIVGLGRLINRGNAASTKEANGEPDRLARTERARRAIGPWVDTQAPPAPEPAPSPLPVAEHGHQEQPRSKPMLPLIAAALPSLLSGLAGTLINIFEPLAREKVNAALGKKGLPVEVSNQIVTTVIDTAKRVTALADPVQATAAVLAKPELAAQVQADALDTLDRLMPVLAQAHKWEQDAWASEEASRNAAHERMQGNPHAEEIDTYLTRAIVRMGIGVLAGTAALMAILAYFKVDNSLLIGLGTLFTTGATTLYNKLGTRFDHAYGSSRGSTAKDAVIGELSRKSPPRDSRRPGE